MLLLNTKGHKDIFTASCFKFHKAVSLGRECEDVFCGILLRRICDLRRNPYPNLSGHEFANTMFRFPVGMVNNVVNGY